MPADIEAVRDLVGSTPDDATITNTWARFDGTTHQTERTALSILRRRRAGLVEGVEAWAVDGDYSERRNIAASLKALDALIGRLERITGDTAGAAANVLTSAPICAPGGPR